jgi:hypothetical protein
VTAADGDVTMSVTVVARRTGLAIPGARVGMNPWSFEPGGAAMPPGEQLTDANGVKRR